ncbi:nitrogen regulation protein NR(I) [Marinobacter sp. EhC06]|jgi:two-component system nitrogen regulation response regulator GlnG|uniref:nitrogen regulation protein NR(I) n=1 Tax=Marinobacter TaxID=2742 RepID=UPI0007D9010D|nr:MULTISPECIES: nitrogen regulation protein NR(I) [Marinobacter]MCD1649493.1 nitrogen regulation protein NR(I) [Marinobacter adhaerens]OAN87543.1 nitrogen regulation protein NR(I) [Marinobacter sp. EhN04]OAN87716.1 nitrogen regulation protein NR(I) [Marinobacter sp. EhC06]
MSQPANVWIIDDDRSIRWVLERALNQAGMQPRVFDSGESIMMRLEHEQPDAIVSDIRMPGVDGITLLSQIVDVHPDVPVIIMTAHSDLESAVTSYQTGAFEYLPKPFDVDDAVALVKRAIAHSHEKRASAEPQAEMAQRNAEIIGEAPAMQEVFRAIGRLSHSNITVLINGESGTGKELVAQALHNHSPRANHPFIALNMAAIPKDLIESELFGHEKGAFTGAGAARQGRFEQANGGTLFLDEIGDMPADTQTRLLRVLADGEFYRVGGTTPIKVDVRIIAATHQDLEKLVQAGTFREDLFHRLNVIRVHLPKLAERREDIPRLMQHFLKRAAKELAVEPKILREEAEEYLTTLPWPGNVRQLENTCRWLTVMASGREIHIDDLPPELLHQAETPTTGTTWQEGLKNWAEQELKRGKKGILDTAVPEFEKIMIETALKHTGGRRRDASILLGWGRNTLTRKINELGMDHPEHEDD